MNAIWMECIGFLAAASTVAAFSCREMLSLRLAAIMANLLFISYAAGLSLLPILCLHCLLLPLNVLRLRDCLRARRASAPSAMRSDPRH